LFLVCAFPIHVWAIILFFRDISWLSERTNLWDAIGVGAYALVFAFTESVFIFLVFSLLGLLFTPKQWEVEKRVSFLSLLILILSAWGMIGQLLFLWNISLPEFALRFLAESGHPLRIMYAVSLAVVVPTVGLPVYLFLKSEKMLRSLQEFGERLSMLTMLYLFFDLAGLAIIIIRNVA
jgi:hypothetical protein